jgi:hypothetical protein
MQNINWIKKKINAKVFINFICRFKVKPEEFKFIFQVFIWQIIYPLTFYLISLSYFTEILDLFHDLLS